MSYPAKTFPVLRRAIQLKHSPVTLVTRSVHFVGSPGNQVVFEACAGSLSCSQFLSAAEAREFGQALLDAAAHYEAEAAKVGQPLPEGALQQGNVDLAPAEHQSMGPGGFDRRAA